jgi:hypothetical protein
MVSIGFIQCKIAVETQFHRDQGHGQMIPEHSIFGKMISESGWIKVGSYCI